MSWAMIDGWREDINEGPYDRLLVRGGWEIFQLDAKSPVKLTDPGGESTGHKTVEEAKAAAYRRGCSVPRNPE